MSAQFFLPPPNSGVWGWVRRETVAFPNSGGGGVAEEGENVGAPLARRAGGGGGNATQNFDESAENMGFRVKIAPKWSCPLSLAQSAWERGGDGNLGAAKIQQKAPQLPVERHITDLNIIWECARYQPGTCSTCILSLQQTKLVLVRWRAVIGENNTRRYVRTDAEAVEQIVQEYARNMCKQTDTSNMRSALLSEESTKPKDGPWVSWLDYQ